MTTKASAHVFRHWLLIEENILWALPFALGLLLAFIMMLIPAPWSLYSFGGMIFMLCLALASAQRMGTRGAYLFCCFLFVCLLLSGGYAVYAYVVPSAPLHWLFAARA